ncbi:MAG: DUF4388 domain-containing protein, partial [Candidatus Eisenbacteria bacterium]|nr:DUF4388 domain-containing protein [Candidatus Eisenbacteria bacterium]
MALQGNLRDFSVSEILQLLGTQKKTGCLLLEKDAERCVVYVHDGRVVSAREPGMKRDDPLVEFLRTIQRFSDEQYRGLIAIHKETGRDLEDLILNGRYMDQEELAGYVERQILDTLLTLAHWEAGTYRFDPAVTWTGARLVRLSAEGALIESARRVDEEKRFRTRFTDPHQLLGVRDLPDPDASLSEEERELFGIIDGQHTVAEVVAAAALTEYEAHEAIHRLMEAEWVEFVGRRDPGAPEPEAARTPVAQGLRFAREAVAVIVGLAIVAGALAGGRWLARPSAAASGPDVFAAAQIRDLRQVLELYRHEHGAYPERLDQLVED